MGRGVAGAWAVAGLVLLAAGWMLFDGVYALVTGDYVTPAEGAYAGRLGPWADLVALLGVPPRALGMKLFFVGYGTAWLGMTAAWLVRGRPWRGMVGLTAGALWYLIAGTLLAAAALVLLFVPGVRRHDGLRRRPAPAAP